MTVSANPPLADLTTLHLGGPPLRLVTPSTEDRVIQAVRRADAQGEPLLILAGGSNLVVADQGFPGTVVRIVTRGVEERHEDGRVVLTVQAGEPWDPFVAMAVERGLAGLEALSGIPGSSGATPIQNVGAYGQEVANCMGRVRVFDRVRDRVTELSGPDCGFGYRSSIFKRRPGRWIVLAVEYRLYPNPCSGPVTYAELARELAVATGDTAEIGEVRRAVLRLRSRKGMVLDPNDRDTASAGSFFTNPILGPREFERFRARLGSFPDIPDRVPAFPQDDGSTKLSAGWLIEQAGFHRGYGNPEGIAISSKHTLALTNRGNGTTRELVALAREIATGVERTFGVRLTPEPVFAGLTWEPARA